MQSSVQTKSCTSHVCAHSAHQRNAEKSCLLLRIVLQDASSEVMKVCPPLKLKVFVDDITAFMEGQYKELPGVAEKVLKTIRREVEEKGFKLSITERGKEGKHKVIASCSFLEKKFQVCSKRGGVGLATSVET